MKLCVSTLMHVPVSNEAVEIVVDGFCGDTVGFSKICQHGQFEVGRDSDHLVWADKALRRLNEYYFLRNNTLLRLVWLFKVARY